MPICPSCGYALGGSRGPLTPRQRDVLDFILATMARERHAPSLREIATHFDFRSLATVHEHLSNLVVKGYLHRDYNKARALSVVG